MKASAEQCDGSTSSHSSDVTTIEEPREKNLKLVPDHDTETTFAKRLFIPLEERGIVKWPLAALQSTEHE